MKPGRLSTVALAGSLAIGGCSSPTNQHPSPNPEAAFEKCVVDYFDSETTSEIATAERFITAAENLANQTGNKEALRVADFLKSNTAVSKADSQQPLFFVTVDSRSLQYCDDLQFLYNSGSFATFNHLTESLLVVTKAEYSDTWAGILMLHEGRHAMNYFDHANDPLEETHTRYFEQALMSTIGGPEYRTLLDSIKDRIRSQQNFDVEHDYQIKIVEISQESIDKVFGKSLSFDEYRLRRSNIYIHAVFEIIAEIYQDYPPQEIAKAQERIMKQVKPV